MMFWNGTERSWPWSTIQASGLNSTPSHDMPVVSASESNCNFRSSIGYFTNIFNLGYDVSRSNPVRNRGFCKPLFEQTTLRECKLTSIDACQPQVKSTVIDSVASYRQWLQTKIHAEPLQETLGVADDELLRIQTEMARGATVIITEIYCKIYEVSRENHYSLDSHLMQRLTHSDDDTLLEFMEDFGTHYVEKATLGGQFYIKFSVNASAAEYLTKQLDSTLETQSITAALYILSRSNLSIHLSSASEQTALTFMKHSHSDVYPSISTLDHNWLGTSFKSPSIIEVELKPLEDLLSKLPHLEKTAAKFQTVRQATCKRFEERSVLDCGTTKDAGFTLPVLSMNPSNSTSSVRASWHQCRQLCASDPLCSSATLADDNQCQLHRTDEFFSADVSPYVSSYVPLRDDLRPVTLWGYATHGTSKLLTLTETNDFDSCLRLCLQTNGCAVAAYSNLKIKSCRLMAKLQTVQLKKDQQSSITFLMSALSTCFVENKQQTCPANSECWHGLCVCRQDFKKNGKSCEPLNHDEPETKPEKKSRKQQKNRTTTPSSIEETTIPITTTSTTRKPETVVYHREVIVTSPASTERTTVSTERTTESTQKSAVAIEKSSTATQAPAWQRIHAAWQASRMANSNRHNNQAASTSATLTNTTPKYAMLRGR